MGIRSQHERNETEAVHVHLVSGDVALDSFRKFNNAKDTLQNDNESGYK
jgi:hypothetical protein